MLDLGSGGGIDILLSAQKVGSEGRAIGLDMSAVSLHVSAPSPQKKKEESPQMTPHTSGYDCPCQEKCLQTGVQPSSGGFRSMLVD